MAIQVIPSLLQGWVWWGGACTQVLFVCHWLETQMHTHMETTLWTVFGSLINHRKACDSELSPVLQHQVSRRHSHKMEAGGRERDCGSPCVPKMYPTIPASRTSECDLPRKEGLCGCKQLGMRSLEAVIRKDWCPHKTRRQRRTEKKEKGNTESGAMRLQARGAQGSPQLQKLREGHRRDSSPELSAEPAL